MSTPYDGFLLLGFGGPEKPEDLWPYLERVTVGRNIPRKRLEHVAEHYRETGGISPINAQNRAILEQLRERVPTLVGWQGPMTIAHRNTPPFTQQGLAELIAQGCRRILVLAMAAYESYSSCRQYREDIETGIAELDEVPEGLVVDKLPPFWDQPWWIEPHGEELATALHQVPGAPVLFVTHSLPMGMAEASGHGNRYVEGHRETAIEALTVARELSGREPVWGLTFSSRSGHPSQQWLEPDIRDALRELAERGETSVIVCPIGFVTEHMEVTHDLDDEAGKVAHELGLTMVRTPTVGTHETFLDGLARWVGAHLVGELECRSDLCDGQCCLRGSQRRPVDL